MIISTLCWLLFKVEIAFEIPDEVNTKGELKGLALLHRSFKVGSNWRNVKSGNAEKFGRCVEPSVLTKGSRCLRQLGFSRSDR
jgi:hypothetical protein